MADIGQLRKRVRHLMDQARRQQAERRARAAEAARAYDAFLAKAALPAFRAVAQVLKAEGVPVEVMTPGGAVRLLSERHRGDAIELELDTTADPPEPLVTITRSRGSRSLRAERPVKAGSPLARLTEDDVIEMLLEEIEPWLA
jgi:hypothetical protein